MVDSSGPSVPRPCNTVGLQNLGDMEGWEEPGGGLYLFKLEGGVYRRAALPGAIKWVIDFRIVNPYMYVRAKQRVTKWQNAGSLLASLVPKEPVKLRYIPTIGYSLSPKKSAKLRLIQELPKKSTAIPPNSTLAISLVAGKSQSSALPLMKGVAVEWDVSAEGEEVWIVIRTPDGGEPPFTTRKDVRVTVGGVVDLAHINLNRPGLAIRRLLMVDRLIDMTALTPFLTS